MTQNLPYQEVVESDGSDDYTLEDESEGSSYDEASEDDDYEKALSVFSRGNRNQPAVNY